MSATPLQYLSGLRKNALWPQGQLLCLNDAENPAINAQGVIGRAVCSFVFCNGTIFVRMNRGKRYNIPPSRFQLGIDQALPRKPLGIVFRRQHKLFNGEAEHYTLLVKRHSPFKLPGTGLIMYCDYFPCLLELRRRLANCFSMSGGRTTVNSILFPLKCNRTSALAVFMWLTFFFACGMCSPFTPPEKEGWVISHSIRREKTARVHLDISSLPRATRPSLFAKLRRWYRNSALQLLGYEIRNLVHRMAAIGRSGE
jgi:hypothetical protein